MNKLTIMAIVGMVAILITGCGASGEGTLSVGSVAPDFSLTDTDGSTYQLSEHLGEQPVLLFFHMADG